MNFNLIRKDVSLFAVLLFEESNVSCGSNVSMKRILKIKKRLQIGYLLTKKGCTFHLKIPFKFRILSLNGT